jgi:hypothetical protein
MVPRLSPIPVAFTLLVIPCVAALTATAPGERPNAETREEPKIGINQPKGPDGLIREGGGDSRAEAMAFHALKWLAAHQAEDGRWSLHRLADHGHCGCSDDGRLRDDAAATACVLLAFAACRETHMPRSGFREVIRRGLKFLLTRQEKDGSFSADITSHAQATLAVCEFCGRDANLRKPAQDAVAFLLGRQRQDGSWSPPDQLGRAGPAAEIMETSRGSFVPDADLLRLDDALPLKGEAEIGWQVNALKLAQEMDLGVPAERALLKAAGFLDKIGTRDKSQYAARPGGPVSPEMTAIGLHCRTYLGWKNDEPALRWGGVSLYRDALPRTVPDVQYHLFATGVIRIQRKDNDLCRRWLDRMTEFLAETQDKGDRPGHAHQKGSWPPSAKDPEGRRRGRLWTTCISILTCREVVSGRRRLVK